MRTASIPAGLRSRALSYYYAHREDIRERMRLWRRAKGIPLLRKRTREERLSRIIFCRCGAQVTTPSYLLRGLHTCMKCRKAQHGVTRERRRYRAVRKARYSAYKSAQRCMQCGSSRRIEFHHRNPNTKTDKISSLATRMGWSAVLKELEKCDPLCHTCHEKAHSS